MHAWLLTSPIEFIYLDCKTKFVFIFWNTLFFSIKIGWTIKKWILLLNKMTPKKVSKNKIKVALWSWVVSRYTTSIMAPSIKPLWHHRPKSDLICVKSPTRSSSTLWFNDADVSVYLQSNDVANDFASAWRKIKIKSYHLDPVGPDWAIF